MRDQALPELACPARDRTKPSHQVENPNTAGASARHVRDLASVPLDADSLGAMGILHMHFKRDASCPPSNLDFDKDLTGFQKNKKMKLRSLFDHS